MRLGRVYIGTAGASTLADIGTCRFPEPVRLEPDLTEPDSFGRRAVRFYTASIVVDLFEVNETNIRNVLDSPTTLYRIFISPSPHKYTSTVAWNDALSDENGIALDNVYVRPSVALVSDGAQPTITLRFSKRYPPVLSVRPEVLDAALFYHEFYDPNRIFTPIVGHVGTYTRSGSIPVFDQRGRIQTVAANTLPWSLTPSGNYLPLINPPTTNRIANNSDANTATASQLTFGSAQSWEGFTLRPRIPSTTAGTHYTERTYSGAEWQNGRVVSYSFVYKPLIGQTLSSIAFASSSGYAEVRIDLTTGSGSIASTSGTPPTLLKAWSMPVFNGYYWVGASVHWASIGSSTSVQCRALVVNASNSNNFAGDGSTAYDIFGADMLLIGSEQIIFPPCAPIITTGSTVSISAGTLSFPFFENYTSVGLTFFFEPELSLISSNFYSSSLWVLGNGDTTVGGTYSPFGIYMHDQTYRFQSDGQTGIDGPGFQITNPRIAVAQHLTNSGSVYFLGTTQITTSNETRSAPLSPSPQAIEFKTGAFGPFWIRRYGIFRGLIHPRKLLT
jgi:hypothetical protein